MQSREPSEGFLRGRAHKKAFTPNLTGMGPDLNPRAALMPKAGGEREIFFATRQTPIFANGALDFTSVENGKM